MPFEGEDPLAHLAQDVSQCEVPAQSQPVLSLPPDLPAAGDGGVLPAWYPAPQGFPQCRLQGSGNRDDVTVT